MPIFWDEIWMRNLGRRNLETNFWWRRRNLGFGDENLGFGDEILVATKFWWRRNFGGDEIFKFWWRGDEILVATKF